MLAVAVRLVPHHNQEVTDGCYSLDSSYPTNYCVGVHGKRPNDTAVVREPGTMSGWHLPYCLARCIYSCIILCTHANLVIVSRLGSGSFERAQPDESVHFKFKLRRSLINQRRSPYLSLSPHYTPATSSISSTNNASILFTSSSNPLLPSL